MLIGITCNIEARIDAKRGCPADVFLTPRAYADAVARTGATPVLLPPVPPSHIEPLVGRLDALVISGGAFDVPPAYYHEPTRPLCGPQNDERSRFERALIQAGLAVALPMLGVCGGMQILNVTLGGGLFQDLSERPGSGEHQQPHDKRQPQHPLRLAPGSRLAQIAGRTNLMANSTHHQAVRTLGTGLQVSATAPDGVIEAIEAPGPNFVLGVQWHPESLELQEHQAIYQALTKAAQTRTTLTR